MKYTISTLIIAISLLGATPAKAATIPGGSLIRGSQPAVYYITNDGKRLAFPNADTYFTWYPDFSTVKFVSDRTLASFPLAGNVTYRPGTRLLKLSSATTVYAVSHGGVLRPIMNQGAVRFEYGTNWTKLVDDLPDAFYTNYKLGDPIYAELDYLPSTALASSATISADRLALAPVAPDTTALKIASVGPATVSGRILSIAVDPYNENIAYAGSASGGVWKTVNMGGSWNSVTPRLNSMHIDALAIDPHNSSTVYAGTGETYMPGDDFAYMGVYVSHDAGANWTLLNNTANLPLSACSSIAIDPTNTSRLYISGNTGVYVSADAGLTWTKTTLTGFVEQLMVSSADHNTIFATGSQTNLWRSTDAGGHWTALAGWNANRGLPDNNPWFNRLTITQSSGKTLANTNHVIYLALADPFRIYRSDSEGNSWNEISRQTLDEKNFAVVADPVDADTVYTAGNLLRRASDGGWTVKVLSLQYNDIRALAFAPSNSKIWYAATDTGVEVSVDNGTTWQARSNGLNTTQWYSLAVSSDGSTIYGAVADLSMLRLNKNGSWETMAWGTAKEIVADPSHVGTLYALSSDSKGVGKSTDNGQAFSQINGNLPVSAGLAHLAIDPTSGGVLYIASGANVYGTDDMGANWYLFGNNGSNAAVASIVVSGTTHRVYVGRADGSIDELAAFGSGNVGSKWTNIYREPNKKPVAELSTVGGYVTVAFDTDWGTRVGRLANGSGKWLFQDITTNLPEGAWLHSLAVDPANRNVIYVSHKAGAFRGVSNDSGKTWSWTRTEDGLPAVEVMDIAVSPITGTVYFATWGRGLYQVTP